MDAAFTPGPWIVEDDDSLFGCAFAPVCTEGGITIAEVCGDSCEPDELTEVDRANARLIAAAPEMFEALERLARRALEYVGHFDGTFDPAMECDAEIRELALAANAALAKARGERE